MNFFDVLVRVTLIYIMYKIVDISFKFFFRNHLIIYGDCYMVARRYEFYVKAQRMNVTLSMPREHEIHIFELTCNFLFKHNH